MKKKLLIVGSIVLFLILIVPYHLNALNDGGTMIFRGLFYEITKLHKLNPVDFGYENGVIIKLFDKTIYKHFSPELIVGSTKQDVTDLYTVNENTKVFAEMDIEYRYKMKKISLKEALEKKKISMETIWGFMDEARILNDGGTILYKSNTNILTKDTFYLVKCQKLDATDTVRYKNENYYFGLSEDILSYCNLS